MKCLIILLIALIIVNVVLNRKKNRKGKKKWPGQGLFNSAKNKVARGIERAKNVVSTVSDAATNIIKVHTYTWKPNTVPKASFKFKPEDRLKDFSADVAKYYTNIAGYGYCRYEKMIANLCCQNFFTEDYVFVAAEKIAKDDYNIGIIRSDKFKRVIIVLPGTRNTKQLLKEFIGSFLVSFEDTNTLKVLQYFNEVYETIKTQIFPHIKKQYELYPEYQFIFTGHSLGGAMATLFSLGAVRNGIINQTDDSPVLITYGAPRPGNDIFANEVMANVPIVFRVVRQGDPVPVLPPCRSDAKISKCLSSLPNGKFVPSTDYPENNENDNSANLPSSNYYSQIGGLKLFRVEFTEYNECGREDGEFHVDDACHSRITTNVDIHKIYARINVGSACSRRRRKFK